ncbi:hypothetical protein T492DRAFT_894991 [Pavlovales sp. CCMP2436]|nr:hypothetical protein T492DRAFT_894991 [Pavlovales sp. CCMP2436]
MVKRMEAAAAADAVNAAADAALTAAVASRDAIRISAAARAKLAAQGSVDALSAAATTGAAGPSTTRGAASSDDDDDDGDADYSEESDEEEGGTGQKRHRRAWERANGPKHDAWQAATRAAGTARLPTSVTAVVPSSRKLVNALNASRDAAAVGTSVVRAFTKLVAGEACGVCSDQKDALLVHLAPARLRDSAASTSKADYQQDKAVPYWGYSPQPGPTYFMSHLTFYVHIICAESLGQADRPSLFGRNRVYTRAQTVGGSKDGNDTLSTIFDFLLDIKSTGVQVQRLRSGWSEDGAHVSDEPH